MTFHDCGADRMSSLQFIILRIAFFIALSYSFSVGSLARIKKSNTSTKFFSSGVNHIQITDTLYPMIPHSDAIQNFRLASGCNRIYRCGNTDSLGLRLSSNQDQVTTNSEVDSPEHILLHRSHLILDLRSPSERDEVTSNLWLSRAPSGSFHILHYDRSKNNLVLNQEISSSKKCVLRIDVLSPKRLFKYLENNWIDDVVERSSYSFYHVFNSQKLHESRMEILNRKGLVGLYEAILETSGLELLVALQAMTIHFEQKMGDVVIHCVQGKDRTGLLVMLCQSILDLNEEEMIRDYHRSDHLFPESTTNLHESQKGKLKKHVFSGAPKEALQQTINTLKVRYGSIDGYLDCIGFNDTWRTRFRKANFLTNKL